jgi:hypothetical protein
MKILLYIVFMILAFQLWSQPKERKGGRQDGVTLAVIIPEELDIPSSAQSILHQKMKLIATENGFDAIEGNSQFAMVPVVVVDTIESTPPRARAITKDIQLQLMIVDAHSQSILSEAFVELQGSGNSEHAAISNSLLKINPRELVFRPFADKGKEAILDFYRIQCEGIIHSAQALAQQQQYEEALYLLIAVPRALNECSQATEEFSAEIYSQYASQQCDQYLEQAREGWMNNDLRAVEQNLEKISPDMDCYSQAVHLVEKISADLSEAGERNWKFSLPTYSNPQQRQQTRLEAAREVVRQWEGAEKYFDWSWLYEN